MSEVHACQQAASMNLLTGIDCRCLDLYYLETSSSTLTSPRDFVALFTNAWSLIIDKLSKVKLNSASYCQCPKLISTAFSSKRISHT